MKTALKRIMRTEGQMEDDRVLTAIWSNDWPRLRPR